MNPHAFQHSVLSGTCLPFHHTSIERIKLTKRKYRRYTDQDIVDQAKNVRSIAELLRKFDLKVVGGNYINIKKNLQRLQVDTSHWTGQAWSKNEQLKDYSEYRRVIHSKPHLIKERGHKCECCERTEWLGAVIPLEVHHKDGNRGDNNKENLELLCPNCHATTDNWRGRKN